MSELLITFTKEKDTKNTGKYAEVVAPGGTAIVGSLYVQKSALQELGNPERITVTIQAD